MSIDKHGELWGKFREKVMRTWLACCANRKRMTWLCSPNGWQTTDIEERKVMHQRQWQGSGVTLETCQNFP